MSDITREQLNEFMKKGWSWANRVPHNTSTAIPIVDKETGVKYKLEVINGILTMLEATE